MRVMKMYYVIATRDYATNKLCYHTGKYTPYGNIYLGDVLEAKRFNSWNDLIGFLKTD